jgi:phosphoglycolate phosphatase
MRDPAQRRFELVVFDWDGTLADSTTLIVHAIQAALRDMGEAVPDEKAARYVIGLGLTDAIRTIAPTLSVQRHSELAAYYRRHYLAREDEVPLFPGAAELLEDLERAGYLLAVATGKSRMGLDRVLARNNLVRRFHATRCGDEGFPKPHPDMLLHLLGRLGVPAERALMIGDTTHDLELARNAGVARVAVAYGAHEAGAFARYAPLATVHSVAELSAWLRDNG